MTGSEHFSQLRPFTKFRPDLRPPISSKFRPDLRPTLEVDFVFGIPSESPPHPIPKIFSKFPRNSFPSSKNSFPKNPLPKILSHHSAIPCAPLGTLSLPDPLPHQRIPYTAFSSPPPNLHKPPPRTPATCFPKSSKGLPKVFQKVFPKEGSTAVFFSRLAFLYMAVKSVDR